MIGEHARARVRVRVRVRGPVHVPMRVDRAIFTGASGRRRLSASLPVPRNRKTRWLIVNGDGRCGPSDASPLHNGPKYESELPRQHGCGSLRVSPMVRGPRQRSTYELSAANETVIHIYGTETLILNFELRRTFAWRFVIADVTKLIIGVDFLAHYNLLVNVRNGRLHSGPADVKKWPKVNSRYEIRQISCCNLDSLK